MTSRQTAWAKANPEKRQATLARYYERNKAAVLARNKAWLKANPKWAEEWNRISNGRRRSKVSAWHAAFRKENPDVMRDRESTQRARKRGAGGRHTAAEIKKLFSLQGGKCAACRCDLSGGYHRDHIIPLADGGDNAIRNIQLLCPKCNMQKHDKHPIEFMQSLGFLL